MTPDRIGQLERKVQQLEEEIKLIKEKGYNTQPPYQQQKHAQANEQWQQQWNPPQEGQYQNQQSPQYQQQAQYQNQQPSQYQQQAQYQNQQPPQYQQQAQYQNQQPQPYQQQNEYQNQQPYHTNSPEQQGSEEQGASYQSPYAANPNLIKVVKKEPRDLENLLVKVWLPRVFIVVLLLGVLWGFLAAVKEGYFTEAVRCWIGGIAAIAMYLIGVRQINKDRAGLGKVLVGGAQAILIITISAAHLLYELIPISLAVVAYMATVIIAVISSLKWKSQTLIVLSTLSGYLFPFLIDSTSPSSLLFVGYQTIFSIVLLVIASRNKYIIAYWFAFGMLHCSFVVAIALNYIEHTHISMGAIVVQHIALFILFVWHHRKAIEQNILQLLAFGLLSLWNFTLYNDSQPIMYNIVLLLSMVLYAWAAYYLHQLVKKETAQNEKISNANQRAAISMVIVNLAILLFVLDQFNYTYGVVVIFIQGILSILLGLRLGYLPQRIIGIVITSIAALNIMTDVPTTIVSEETFAWLVLLAGIPALYIGCGRWLAPEKLEHSKKSLSLLLWAEACIGFIFLTIMVDISTEQLSSELRHFSISGAWLAYALAAIVLGIVWKKAKARLTGIIMLFAILVKVLFIDLPDVSLTIRALIFILLGAVGIVASRVLYTNKSDSNVNEEAADESKSVEQ